MIYETFGNDIAAPFRIEEIVKTVVIPSEIRAGVASIDIQNETFIEITDFNIRLGYQGRLTVKP